jgi:hypothetical protein
VKWRDVQPGNSFMTRYPSVAARDDVWVVLAVRRSEEHEDFILIRYSYLHNLGDEDAVSEFHVDSESHVDYDPMFEPT